MGALQPTSPFVALPVFTLQLVVVATSLLRVDALVEE